jgi:hypothetical protein
MFGTFGDQAVSPADICRQVFDAGMSIHVDANALVLKPAERLTPGLRALLVEQKPTLLGYLNEVKAFNAELLARAMATSARHADNEQARSDMRADIEATPPHLRADLLAHFTATYRGNP